MFQNSVRTFWFFLIIFVIGLSWVRAGEDDDYEQFVQPAIPSNFVDTTVSQLQGRDLEKEQNLIRYLEGIDSVERPKPWQQVVGSLGGTFMIIPSLQVMLPLFFIGLLSVGVTTEMLPSTWYVITFATLIPATLTGIAVYNGLLNCFQSVPSDVLQAYQRVTNHNHSCGRTALYSTIKVFQFLLYQGLLTAMTFKMLSRLDPDWGNYRVWAGIFSVLAIVPVYSLFVQATDRSDKSFLPFLAFFREQCGKENSQDWQRKEARRIVQGAQDTVRHYGLTDRTEELEKLFNVRQQELPGVVKDIED